ncbi:MAG: restriction endonuclease [Bacteroidota bacterium]
MNVFVVRADFGSHTHAFKENGYAGIGWFEEALPDFKKETILTAHRTKFPDDSDGRTYQNSGQIKRFLTEIKEGDIVITPFNDGRLLVGKAKGNPYFQKDSSSPYCYRIKVDWKQDTLSRYELSIPLQNTLRSSLTVFNVSQVEELALAAGYTAAQKQEKKEVFTRAFIYKVIKDKLLTLSADEFEQLVAYVLQSIGFEATQRTGKVGDGGIDFEGTLDVMGVASTKLQVQVKRYEKTKIGERDIRNFRGALKRDYQGTFITLSSFHKKALESANDADRVPINLINGNQFIDIFIEQYDKVMEFMYEEDNDELAAKLRFKKALIPEQL